MAATILTVLDLDESGVEPAYTAATVTEGDQFANDDRTFVHIKNGSGGSIDAVIQASESSVFMKGFGDILLPDVTIAIPAGEERMFQCPPARFNSSGKCTIICSSVTTVTMAAFKMTKV
jgi:hypothetical protein